MWMWDSGVWLCTTVICFDAVVIFGLIRKGSDLSILVCSKCGFGVVCAKKSVS